MNQTIRTLWNRGITFQEKSILSECSRRSLEGWHLNKITSFRYEFSKGDSEHRDYLLDIHIEESDEAQYLANMKKAGWNLAASHGEFYIFYSRPKKEPIYSDGYDTIKKYNIVRKTNMGAATVSGIIAAIVLILIFTGSSFLKGDMTFIYLGILFVSGIIFLITIATSFSYENRINRIRERYGLKK